MGLTASFWAHCDLCGADSGAGQISAEDAIDYVLRGGWHVHRGYQGFICDECYDEDKVYHFQFRLSQCVLCESGEHVRIWK